MFGIPGTTCAGVLGPLPLRQTAGAVRILGVGPCAPAFRCRSRQAGRTDFEAETRRRPVSRWVTRCWLFSPPAFGVGSFRKTYDVLSGNRYRLLKRSRHLKVTSEGGEHRDMPKGSGVVASALCCGSRGRCYCEDEGDVCILQTAGRMWKGREQSICAL